MTRKAAIIGGGVIGGGWTARFLLNGWDVSVYDPGPAAERNVGVMLANARLAVPALVDGPMPPEGRLSFAGTMSEALNGAEYVQESVSERLEVKHAVYAQMQQSHPDVLIGSSTSGYKAVDLQKGAVAPHNIIVAHPFTPVYLLPLCEISASAANPPEVISRTVNIARDIGMFPLVMRKEIDAFIGSRFLEAVWREALWMLKDGVATTEEIDDAIRMSFGLRWAQMGLFENYRIAGGEAGMRHFMAQFGPCLKWPWTKLTDVPEFNDELVDLVAGQSDAQSGHMPIRDLERLRDQNLVGILRSLKDRNVGAGRVLREHDERMRQALPDPVPETAKPMEMARMTVLPGWIDYNGHMTESRYLFACSETTDAFLRHIGADLAYVGTGYSYYTAETHLMHLDEARLGDALTGTVQILMADEKRIHAFISILKDGSPVATLEQMYLHVDMKAGKTVPAPQSILDRVMPIAAAHAALPRPAAAGRHVGQRRT